MLKQDAKPALSASAQQALDQYHQSLEQEADLSAVTIRNYLSDLRLFMAWCEQRWTDGSQENSAFWPKKVATPTITAYRDYLQRALERKPATINRYLVSIKRYFRWLADTGQFPHDPARVVKLVDQTARVPRHLEDQEEAALVTAAQQGNNLRDYTLIVFMLHTGLRMSEVCHLKWGHITLKKRSGQVQVWGKGNKYRAVPLNVTVRKALAVYKKSVSTPQNDYVFLSQRTKTHLSPRGLGYLLAKIARRAGLEGVRPHDLRHRFGYRMAQRVPLHRLAQIMGHDSLDTTLIYIQGTEQDLQQAVETIAWQ